MATELENLVPEADVEIEGMRGPKGDKGDSYVLTEADKEEIAQKVDTIIDAETDKSLTISGKPADAKAAGDEINDLKADLNKIQTATSENVGKVLKAKTVESGKVTEWEFVDVELPIDSVISGESLNPVENKAIHSMFGNIPALSEYGGNVCEILEYLIDAVENPVDPNAIDVCLFAGQSNMDGRGDATQAPTVPVGQAYFWEAGSGGRGLVDFAAEPSLIPAFVKQYYKMMRVPIVEVKRALGGITIGQYNSQLLSLAKDDLTACINYLTSSGKTVRNVFMLWNQGENDVSEGTSMSDYESSFAHLKSEVMSVGVTKIFIINIGQHKRSVYSFNDIRATLESLCDGNTVIMVSDKFRRATDYMKDDWHYQQAVYNLVGQDAAKNAVKHLKSEETAINQFDLADIVGEQSEYLDADNDWETSVNGSTKIVLLSYTGSNPDVAVYKYAKKNGHLYFTNLMIPNGNYTPTFKSNKVIENLVLDNDIQMVNGAWAISQSGMSVFEDMSNLKTVTGIPYFSSIEKAFHGTSKLVQAINITDMHGSFVDAFRESGVTDIIGEGTDITNLQNGFRGASRLKSVCDLDGAYKTMAYCFFQDANLETVGELKATSLTNMSYAFYGCSKLTGTIKIHSTNVSNVSSAFTDCDLSKITFEVPVDSTTYTTLSTAYPSANIVTFTPDA